MAEKKIPLQGYRKMIIGLIVIGIGIYVGETADWSEAFNYVALGALLFCGANIVDRIFNNKKGVR